MGRKRKHRRDLPERVYYRHGAYYFVDRAGKWHNLGRDHHQALIEHARINRAGALLTLGQLMDRYVSDVLPGKAPATQRGNLLELAKLRAVFGHMRPDDVEPGDLYDYIEARGSLVRANRELSLLSHIFTKAIEWRAATGNPCRLVRRPREAPRERYVTDAEYQAVHALASPVLQCAMDLAYLTGLRQGRLLALRASDCREDGIHVDAGKGGKRLVIRWTDDLRAVVDRCRRLRAVGSMYLLCTRQGQKYSSAGFKAMWRRTRDKALATGAITESFTFHDLRAKSASDHATGEHLGHRNAATLERVYRRRPAVVSPVRPNLLDNAGFIGQGDDEK